jgi:outer membrane protein assembly factor BamD (BamD/ComL family)
LKVEADFSGTSAAARAVLFAANNAYAEGKMTEAQGLFERFLRDFPESPSRATALLGVASCLDAQGKTADAATRYQEIIQKFTSDAAAPAAKSALARLYEAQNQLQPAMGLYQDLMRTEQNTSYGLESMVRLQNLVARHPELTKSPATNAVASVPLK